MYAPRMRIRVAVVLCVMMLAACYTKRTIIVPPTEHGIMCARDAAMQHQICMLQQRGWVRCDELRDMELMLCPGAYEATGPTDAGEESTTYTLPGYRP